MPLIVEIALGILLAVFLLRVIGILANLRLAAKTREPEPIVCLVRIGGLKECIFDKEKGKGYCCRDMLYDPAFADTVHQFATYDEAKAWAKEMVNVRLNESWQTPQTTYWHGNLEVMAVTLSVAARWMEHRTADGKVDPVYLAECAARAQVNREKQAKEDAEHASRMQERLVREQNQKTIQEER